MAMPQVPKSLPPIAPIVAEQVRQRNRPCLAMSLRTFPHPRARPSLAAWSAAIPRPDRGRQSKRFPWLAPRVKTEL